jgi:hypothetical protein
MTCGAILWPMILPVAIQTRSHVVIHCPYRHRRLDHVSVACRATNARPVMLRVLKFHMRRRCKFINPLPRNFNFLIGVFNHFFHFCLIAPQFRVAKHTFIYRRDSRLRPRIRSNMAIYAGQANHLNMFVVRKRDGLLCTYTCHYQQQNAHFRPPCSLKPPNIHQFRLTYHATLPGTLFEDKSQLPKC